MIATSPEPAATTVAETLAVLFGRYGSRELLETDGVAVMRSSRRDAARVHLHRHRETHRRAGSERRSAAVDRSGVTDGGRAGMHVQPGGIVNALERRVWRAR